MAICVCRIDFRLFVVNFDVKCDSKKTCEQMGRSLIGFVGGNKFLVCYSFAFVGIVNSQSVRVYFLKKSFVHYYL